MVVPGWATQSGGARPQPILGRGPFARDRPPNYLVTLEVPGRRSGRIISFPLVMVVVGGERYLVSMLGEKANWVRNLEAAGGNATLRHGRREDIRLEEVAEDRRAPVLEAYLKKAPGARPHVPVDKDAPLEAFEKVSSRFPAFRVVPRGAARALPRPVGRGSGGRLLGCLVVRARGVGRAQHPEAGWPWVLGALKGAARRCSPRRRARSSASSRPAAARVVRNGPM